MCVLWSFISLESYTRQKSSLFFFFFKIGVILTISNTLTAQFLFAPSYSTLNRQTFGRETSNLQPQLHVSGRRGSKGLLCSVTTDVNKELNTVHMTSSKSAGKMLVTEFRLSLDLDSLNVHTVWGTKNNTGGKCSSKIKIFVEFHGPRSIF